MSLLALLLLGLPALGAWHVATRTVGDWQLGLGLAALAWASWATLVAELLSVGELLTRPWVAAAWALPALAALVVLVRDRPVVRISLARWSRFERVLLGAVGVSLALTLLVALVSAPNNWDSHVYHLTRAAVWDRLDQVAHYATNVDPQNYQPPGAELLIANGYVLAGGDRLAALVQWSAYACVIVLAAAAARALGGAHRTQLVAATLVATTPLAILEASSTQNDLVLAMWLALAATLAAVVWSGQRSRLLVLAASLAIGMAVLTKGTGLLLGLPVGVLLAAASWRQFGATRTVSLGVLGLVLAALPSTGHWLRMHDTYGSLVVTTHAGVENPYAVDDPDLRSLGANLVRNATNHLDLPTDAASDAVEDAARWAVRAIGADPDDPRTTFLGQPFKVGPFGPHEDHAGSALLLVLGLWAAISTLRARRGVQLAWLAVIAAQVLLFCWLVTWQNWHVRLHLPVTLLVAVLVAVRLGARPRRRLETAVCVVALAMAPLYLLFNVTRPLVGSESVLTMSRTSTYFIPRPQLEAPYEEVVDRLARARVREAGLVTRVDDWQYALHVLGREQEPQVRFREVQTTGTAPEVDAVVCVACAPEQQVVLERWGLTSVPLDAGGLRHGKGDDVLAVELWMRHEH